MADPANTQNNASQPQFTMAPTVLNNSLGQEMCPATNFLDQFVASQIANVTALQPNFLPQFPFSPTFSFPQTPNSLNVSTPPAPASPKPHERSKRKISILNQSGERTPSQNSENLATKPPTPPNQSFLPQGLPLQQMQQIQLAQQIQLQALQQMQMNHLQQMSQGGFSTPSMFSPMQPVTPSTPFSFTQVPSTPNFFSQNLVGSPVVSPLTQPSFQTSNPSPSLTSSTNGIPQIPQTQQTDLFSVNDFQSSTSNLPQNRSQPAQQQSLTTSGSSFQQTPQQNFLTQNQPNMFAPLTQMFQQPIMNAPTLPIVMNQPFMQIPLPQQTPLPSLQQIQQYHQYQQYQQLLLQQKQQPSSNLQQMTPQQQSNQSVPTLNFYQIQNQSETTLQFASNKSQDVTMVPESPKNNLLLETGPYDFTGPQTESKMEITESKPKVGTKRRNRHAPPKPFDSERSRQAMSRPRDEFGSFTSKQKTNVLDLTFKLHSSEFECNKLRQDLADKDQEMAELKAKLQAFEIRNQEQQSRMQYLEMVQQRQALEQLDFIRSFKARTQYLSQLEQVFEERRIREEEEIPVPQSSSGNNHLNNAPSIVENSDTDHMMIMTSPDTQIQISEPPSQVSDLNSQNSSLLNPSNSMHNSPFSTKSSSPFATNDFTSNEVHPNHLHTAGFPSSNNSPFGTSNNSPFTTNVNDFTSNEVHNGHLHNNQGFTTPHPNQGQHQPQHSVPATWFNYASLWNDAMLPAFRQKIDFSTIQLRNYGSPNFVDQARIEYFEAQRRWQEQIQQVKSKWNQNPVQMNTNQPQ